MTTFEIGDISLSKIQKKLCNDNVTVLPNRTRARQSPTPEQVRAMPKAWQVMNLRLKLKNARKDHRI